MYVCLLGVQFMHVWLEFYSHKNFSGQCLKLERKKEQSQKKFYKGWKNTLISNVYAFNANYFCHK